MGFFNRRKKKQDETIAIGNMIQDFKEKERVTTGLGYEIREGNVISEEEVNYISEVNADAPVESVMYPHVVRVTDRDGDDINDTLDLCHLLNTSLSGRTINAEIVFSDDQDDTHAYIVEGASPVLLSMWLEYHCTDEAIGNIDVHLHLDKEVNINVMGDNMCLLIEPYQEEKEEPQHEEGELVYANEWDDSYT